MLTLPSTVADCLSQAVAPALALLGVERFDTSQARVMLLAIARQESGLRTRQQLGGPARGLWQNEQPVLQLLLNNQASAAAVRALCAARAVAAYAPDMYAALLNDDIFAAGVARLILWCDAEPLPVIGDQAAAWTNYCDRTWRPGAPRPNDWPANYAAALAAVAQA